MIHSWVQIMVHLRVLSVICLKLHSKVKNSSPKDQIKVANDSVYGTHLRMILKMDSKVQTDTKSGQLKNEKSALFSPSGDAQESTNRTMTNAFEVRLMIQLMVQMITHLELYIRGTSRFI